MMQRLKYWLFQRGKHCRSCCLWCEYYDLCKNEVTHERQSRSAALPSGRKIEIHTLPSWERKLQRKIIKRSRKERRQSEKF